jgi:dolichyl-phosphate beta-glucosyltransferase
MAATPYLSLVIPAYNEAATIGRTLRQCKLFFDRKRITHELIVVADGTDGCREIAAELAVHDPCLQVLGSANRGGKGSAIRLGVRHAQGQIIGFADADYKTPIEELAKLLPWLDRGFDLVIGSRGLAESHIRVRQPLHRRLGSWAFGVGMHCIIGLWGIKDTQCGFKFFRQAVAKDLFARQSIDGYMFDVEVLALAQACGYRIKEVGVCWQDDGDSRLELLAGNWRNFKDIMRMRFGRLSRIAATPTEAVCDRTDHRAAA